MVIPMQNGGRRAHPKASKRRQSLVPSLAVQASPARPASLAQLGRHISQLNPFRPSYVKSQLPGLGVLKRKGEMTGSQVAPQRMNPDWDLSSRINDVTVRDTKTFFGFYGKVRNCRPKTSAFTRLFWLDDCTVLINGLVSQPFFFAE